jgi:hypothetical protein
VRHHEVFFAAASILASVTAVLGFYLPAALVFGVGTVFFILADASKFDRRNDPT